LGLTGWFWISILVHQAPEERLQELEMKSYEQPASAQVSFELAEMLWRTGEIERCKSLLVKLKGTQTPGWYWLNGVIQEREGQFSIAERFFRKELLTPYPRKASYSALGRVLMAQNRMAEAGEAYLQSGLLYANPDDFLMAARMAHNNGDPELAEQRLREGITLVGPAVVLRFARVEALLAMGDVESALAEINALLLLAPKHQKWLLVRDKIVLNFRMD
jgi:tetratricopeptide (TPR) repeat protein